MRSRRFLAAILALAFLGCQPGEQAVLIDVHTQADLQSLRVIVRSYATGRRWEEPIRRVNRTADDINGAPLRVAVILPAPDDVLVHLEGITPSLETVVATRCYVVNGVTVDEVMLVGPLGELDLDDDGFVADAATICREPGEDGRSAVSCDADNFVCPGTRADDCDAANGRVHPGAETFCLDGIDQDCDGADEPCDDQDGDGFTACPADPGDDCDCNDSVPSIHPGAVDICNDGIDQDCACNDGSQDCDARERDACCDADGDGSPACGGIGPDCDDDNPAVRPGVPEVCDGIDNDCNGLRDELDECRGPDIDGDGVPACSRVESGPCEEDQYDCDPGRSPNVPERCGNGIDDDLDGMIDEACPPDDADGDGVAPPRDCDDTNPLVFPPGPGREPIDFCEDGIANSCIPGEDRSCADDVDGDRWIEPPACETSAAINPSVPETCNGVDDDCDGIVDEVLASDYGCDTRARMRIDYATDPLNCGSCRNACDTAVALTCVGGQCHCPGETEIGPCTMGDEPRCCPGTGCTDVSTDNFNCGQCGNICGTNEVCMGGRCVCGSSSAAVGMGQACPEAPGHMGPEEHRCCEDAPTVDRCVHVLGSELAHCGGCGMACAPPHAIGRCNAGTCEIDECESGFADCNGIVADGCETPLNTLTDCGGCGVPCSRTNATATCATGTCQISTCNDGFENCDGVDANGCERSIRTLTDCGGCGIACSRTNATATCASGTCAIASCTPPFENCDGVDANGCEANLTSDAHCGACRNDCGANASCVSRACTCNARQLDCTAGSPWCETPFSTSDCGGCGVTCPTGQTCDVPSGRCFCGSTPGGVGSGSACPTGQGCCGGTCTPLDTLTNCGSCGVNCNPELADNCASGTCRCGAGDACPATHRCCGGTCVPRFPNACTSCSGTTCDTIRSDRCTGGSCRCGTGSPCGPTQRCCGGSCVPLYPGNCTACGATGACDTTQADGCSSSGTCTCGGGLACGPGQRCCGGACVPLIDNCTACGVSCGATADRCTSSGGCACGSGGGPCTGGQICCSGACVDPLSDETNCGACGNRCGANETCLANGSGQGVCVCGNDASNDPAGAPGTGEACPGSQVCCEGGTGGDADDKCAPTPGDC